jgi:hypothetical protein
MTLLRMLSFHSNSSKIETPSEKKTPKLAPASKTKLEIKAETKSETKEKHMPNIVEEPQPTPYSTLNINSQQEWEKITKALEFNTPARLLLKNTLFESSDNQTLTLSLDEQFSTLLTDSIQVTIQTTLQANFGDITLNINSKKLKTQTLAQKETQVENEKMAVLQQTFLADKGVQKLQQVFNAVIDTNSIKEISKVS